MGVWEHARFFVRTIKGGGRGQNNHIYFRLQLENTMHLG